MLIRKDDISGKDALCTYGGHCRCAERSISMFALYCMHTQRKHTKGRVAERGAEMLTVDAIVVIAGAVVGGLLTVVVCGWRHVVVAIRARTLHYNACTCSASTWRVRDC